WAMAGPRPPRPPEPASGAGSHGLEATLTGKQRDHVGARRFRRPLHRSREPAPCAFGETAVLEAGGVIECSSKIPAVGGAAVPEHGKARILTGPPSFFTTPADQVHRAYVPLFRGP